ncbi:MAG TPA: hypothetical protein VFS28_04005 [Gemmatimonadales bacterium]|nr:hypothetical protein [Gemmatimonadales bacterium]
MIRQGVVLVLAAALAVLPRAARAQGYRLQLVTGAQAASYRGVTLDSVPAGSVTTGPDGGLVSPEGFAVTCTPAAAYCLFYRPGPTRTGAPITSTADLTLWGLGVRGLSVHVLARAGAELGDANAWPGTSPALQLIEGYGEYANERILGRVGRLAYAAPFGYTGYDGASLTLRDPHTGLELTGYGGWGLAQGVALPVTSPALNPLNDFQPEQRQVVAGAAAGIRSRWVDARLDYQRQVDQRSDYFVSERAYASVVARPVRAWSLAGGVEYDMAADVWGSADLTVAYRPARGWISGSVTGRRYHPHFDLWTIWGAFSPVSYKALDGSLDLTPIHRVSLHATGETYKYDPTETSTPLTDTRNTGWRYAWTVRYSPPVPCTLELGHHADFGPGAGGRGVDGGATCVPDRHVTVGLHAGTLDRTLEFRYDDATVTYVGINASYVPAERWRFQADVSRYSEERQRPDPAGFNWDQFRVSGRITLLLGSADALTGVPAAVQAVPDVPRAP